MSENFFPMLTQITHFEFPAEEIELVYSNSELSITGFIIAYYFDILLRIFNVVMSFVLYVFRSI